MLLAKPKSPIGRAGKRGKRVSTGRARYNGPRSPTHNLDDLRFALGAILMPPEVKLTPTEQRQRRAWLSQLVRLFDDLVAEEMRKYSENLRKEMYPNGYTC